MTPLELHLSRRNQSSAQLAYRIIRAADLLGAPAGKWVSKLVFNGANGHMRYVPPELALHSNGDGSWAFSLAGKAFATTRPLLDLVAPLTKPVSIVASGPSALDYPWDQLRNGQRCIIAVNGATTLLKKLGIRPDLMVVIDDTFCQTGAAHFAAAAGVPLVIETIAGATWAALAPEDFASRPVALLERVNSWHGISKLSQTELEQLNERSGKPWLLPVTMDRKFRVGWSSRPEWGFFSGRTVTYAALQVAVGLGAQDIEIIGMDLGGKRRAYAEPGTAQPSYLENHYDEFILPSFELMARSLAGTQVRVRNLSPVCPLPRDFFA